MRAKGIQLDDGRYRVRGSVTAMQGETDAVAKLRGLSELYDHIPPTHRGTREKTKVVPMQPPPYVDHFLVRPESVHSGREGSRRFFVTIIVDPIDEK